MILVVDDKKRFDTVRVPPKPVRVRLEMVLAGPPPMMVALPEIRIFWFRDVCNG